MSELYKIGRLISSERFTVRVEAAMLKYAQSLTLGGTLTQEKNFAIWVLKNPMQPENSMIALAAADPAVIAAATIAEDGIVVDDTPVPDSAINNAVSAKWSLVATKFPISNPQ